MAAFKIDVEYEFGDLVYLRTDPQQLERLVTGYILRPGSAPIYKVTFNTGETAHFGIELSTEKDEVRQYCN